MDASQIGTGSAIGSGRSWPGIWLRLDGDGRIDACSVGVDFATASADWSNLSDLVGSDGAARIHALLEGMPASAVRRCVFDLDARHSGRAVVMASDSGGAFEVFVDRAPELARHRAAAKDLMAREMSLADEIHDGLAQQLTALSMGLSAPGNPTDEPRPGEPDVGELLTRALQSTRALTRALATPLVGSGDLSDVLETLRLELQRFVEVRIERDVPEDTELDPGVAQVLTTVCRRAAEAALEAVATRQLRLRATAREGRLSLAVIGTVVSGVSEGSDYAGDAIAALYAWSVGGVTRWTRPPGRWMFEVELALGRTFGAQ